MLSKRLEYVGEMRNTAVATANSILFAVSSFQLYNLTVYEQYTRPEFFIGQPPCETNKLYIPF